MTFETCLRKLRSPGQTPDRRRLRRGSGSALSCHRPPLAICRSRSSTCAQFRGVCAEYRRCRQGHGDRRHQGRGDLPGSVPRARDNGADELHRSCPQGRLRSLGRLAGRRARQAAAAKTAGLPLDQVVVHNHLIGGGFGRRLEIDGGPQSSDRRRVLAGGSRSTASFARSRSPSMSTAPSKSSGRARKTSSTTCTGPISSIEFLPVSTRKEWRSPGTIASRANRSSRDGSHPRMVSVRATTLAVRF
jgi:hypothetical protein